jgi:hypothetical protein
MVTLTYPGEWASVLPNGRALKRHLQAYRKRFTRYVKRFGVSSWSALWFLEFQERGAPHVHLLVWGLDGVKRDLLRKWSSRAWARIVGHADKSEFQKHLKAGSSIQKMRAKHFGYAAKYASKMRQKVVPAEFSDVGRFWGLWSCTLPAGEVFSFKLDTAKYLKFVNALIKHVYSVGGFDFVKRLERMLGPSVSGDGAISYEVGCTFTLFGAGAKGVVTGFV